MPGTLSQLPLDRLKKEAQGFGQALGEKGLSQATGAVGSLTGRLTNLAEGKVTDVAKGKLTDLAEDKGGMMPNVAKNMVEGDNPAKAGTKALGSTIKDKVKGVFGGGSGGGSGGKIKVTNIIESIDVPVSREVAYQQWTQFEEFSQFMKKVENVKQEEDAVLNWQAQIFWSHRRWKATIEEQVPNERIVWKSEADKGHVSGAVTFHELSPDLTRILLTMEYHPKGFFEHTGNIWRAQGRRARLELKHFRRHVATNTILHQDELQGWPGEIHEGEVTDENAADWGSDQDQEDQDQPDPDQQDPDQEEDQEEEQDQDQQDEPGEEEQAEDQQGEDQQDEEENQQEDEQRSRSRQQDGGGDSRPRKRAPQQRRSAKKSSAAKKSTAAKKSSSAKKSASSGRRSRSGT